MSNNSLLPYSDKYQNILHNDSNIVLDNCSSDFNATKLIFSIYGTTNNVSHISRYAMQVQFLIIFQEDID